MFDLSGQREALETLVPVHHNRLPSEDARDPSLWALEGILAPGFPSADNPARILLAANISDVEIKVGDEEKVIYGSDIIAMFASARFGRLSAEYPDADLMDGDEVRPLLPRKALQPDYEKGLRLMLEQTARTPIPALGGVAGTGAGIRLEPVPVAA